MSVAKASQTNLFSTSTRPGSMTKRHILVVNAAQVIGKMALNNHKRETIWKRNTYGKIITTQISQRLLFLETGPNIFFVMAGLGVVAEE